jgi:hypothetical protein
MKKMLVALLISVLAISAFAGPYSFVSAVICGNKSGTDDTTFVNAPDYSHPYGVAAAANGRIWSSSYYNSQRYDKAIMVYDPEFAILDTVGPEIIGADDVPDTIGSCRGFKTTGDGNVVYADWTNDYIRVFDQDDYSVIAQSPGPDDPVFPNVGGGIGAFVYDGEQYYLSQQIVGSTVVMWDADFNVVDTLRGGPGGRNLACTADGGKIISPGLGSAYFVEWSGNPDDGYAVDTVYMEDLGDGKVNSIMYVSEGPNGYFWLMSRDNALDGILVVDPDDDYSVKLSTYTDSSVTSLAGFDLGIAMDNMGPIWLEAGLIDTSDWLTTLGYNQPQWMRAPCQVAYTWGGPGTQEYLYVADFYGYTLKQFARDTETSVADNDPISENGFKLNIAYPNPFNPSVTIPYELSSNGNVAIDVYDVAGKKVASLVNEYKYAGNYNIHFDASNLSSGNYLVKMTFDNKTVAQKISLVK